MIVKRSTSVLISVSCVPFRTSLMANKSITCGTIHELRNAFSRKFDTHPPPRNANNVEPYTFVTVFFWKFDAPDPPPPQLHYVMLEWPKDKQSSRISVH